MPTRIYKADTASGACATCRAGFSNFEPLLAPFQLTCGDCGAPVHVVIQAVTLGAVDPRLAEGPLYMSQLVKPGDPSPRTNPDNYVNGPHSWQRKVDQAQRDGVRLASSAEINDERSPTEIKRAERRESQRGS